MITEYYAGGELLNKIMTLKTFSEYCAAKIMKQVLSAVSYCHALHIVHRDLKPENLVLESDDIESNVKVIDFGTSTMFKSTEKLRDIMGTVCFLFFEFTTFTKIRNRHFI
jgi:calcium-dependent protein kinase